MIPLIILSLNHSEISDSYTYGSALNKITVEPNFSLEEGTFEKLKNSKDSGCITTPNNNQYCYEKPRIIGDDTVISTIVGNNGINGEVYPHGHFKWDIFS